MASENVIVRASNPGQFEADNEPPWTRDGNSDTLFHMGKNYNFNINQSWNEQFDVRKLFSFL